MKYEKTRLVLVPALIAIVITIGFNLIYSSCSFKKITTIPYVKNRVYMFPLYFGYKTTVEVGQDEKIIAESIVFGRDDYIANLTDDNSLNVRLIEDKQISSNFSFKTDKGRRYRFFIPKKPPKIEGEKDMDLNIIFSY